MLNLNCVICSELFGHSDDVYVTTCGHMFHFACLKQWIERSRTCPQCRHRCTDRNIFRVYFNLSNLNVSEIDVGSLQEHVDNVNLQLKMKEQELEKAKAQIKELKGMQKMCMKTISGLEQTLQKNDFVLLSYTDQIKMLKHDAKLAEDLRKENKSLKLQIDTMDGISSIITGTKDEIEKLLKYEYDSRKLATWVVTLKRELLTCENKKTDLRNVLKIVQNDLRKEIDVKRMYEDLVSQLESENYTLNEKIKTLQAAQTTNASKSNLLNSSILTPLLREENRLTISPTIKANVKQIEDSDSPYLNIKSSSIGLVPLFKRNASDQKLSSDPTVASKTTTKVATLKVSPSKTGCSGASNNGAIRKACSSGASNNGALHKASSDTAMSEKYSIFKKPRFGTLTASASVGGATTTMKPLAAGIAYNGFGGTVKIDPFATLNPDNDDDAERERKLRKLNDAPATATTFLAMPKPITANLSIRLKAGGLRDFKVSK